MRTQGSRPPHASESHRMAAVPNGALTGSYPARISMLCSSSVLGELRLFTMEPQTSWPSSPSRTSPPARR